MYRDFDWRMLDKSYAVSRGALACKRARAESLDLGSRAVSRLALDAHAYPACCSTPHLCLPPLPPLGLAAPAAPADSSYVCSMAAQAGQTSIFWMTNDEQKRGTTAQGLCGNSEVGAGKNFAREGRVNTDAFKAAITDKQGAGCRTAPLRWIDAPSQDRRKDPNPLYRPGQPTNNAFASSVNLTSLNASDPGYNSTFTPNLTSWLQATSVVFASKVMSTLMDPSQVRCGRV